MIDGSIILFKELYKDYHEIFRVEITSLGLALCVLLQKYKFIILVQQYHVKIKYQ